MEEARPARGRRRRFLIFMLIFATVGGLWYGPRAVGYAAHLRVYTIPSGSMGPAILPGDRIMVDIRGGTPRRGEIWTFAGPNSAQIKRVIGMPGETVEVRGGRVRVDGKPLTESYLAAPMNYTMPPVRIASDQHFLMGDSRNASADSHVWGPLHESRLIGRAEYRVWPSNRIGSLR